MNTKKIDKMILEGYTDEQIARKLLEGANSPDLEDKLPREKYVRAEQTKKLLVSPDEKHRWHYALNILDDGSFRIFSFLPKGSSEYHNTITVPPELVGELVEYLNNNA